MRDKLVQEFKPDGCVTVEYLGKPMSGMTTLTKDIAMMMNKAGYHTLSDMVRCRVYFHTHRREIPNE